MSNLNLFENLQKTLKHRNHKSFHFLMSLLRHFWSAISKATVFPAVLRQMVSKGGI